uniref:uncharacterized protein LOC120811792 isoform X1 n=1 Tax=Gasterosteus aculeatus aculeatus TaxID=481459 RepID=UPI001A97E502|nr:uncharacterized protein LOC120811792 isoform X1 [Gasterosteus aculeatus aculeatus]
MRGLTLLCLWGLFLTASTVWPPGGQTPMSGPLFLNITANTSTEQVERSSNNTSSEATATALPVESTHELTPPKDGEDSQLPKEHPVQNLQERKAQKKPTRRNGRWHPLVSNVGFPASPEDGENTKP